MKPTQTIAILVATLIAALLFWRESRLADELAELRAALENIPESRAVAAVAETRGLPRDAAGATTEKTLPADARERIADLERVANGHADLLEDLMRKLSDAGAARQKALAPGWSALQAIGPPDTMTDGDRQTAWAPAQPDAGEEWLGAQFANPVEVAQIIVRETCGPGCITKITSTTDSGTEVTLWQGEPPRNASPSNTIFNIPPGHTTGRIKVYLDTSRVAGWNELDAIEIVGRDGSRQWVQSASASSSYGGGNTVNLSGSSLGELYIITNPGNAAGGLSPYLNLREWVDPGPPKR